jgi:hypothetical protein
LNKSAFLYLNVSNEARLGTAAFLSFSISKPFESQRDNEVVNRVVPNGISLVTHVKVVLAGQAFDAANHS